MAEESNIQGLSPGLHRQRRNLILISTVILFLDFADADIKGIKLIGLDISLGKPEVINYFLLAFLFYFLIRYYQYLCQESDLKIKKEFYTKLYLLTYQKVHTLKNQCHPDTESYDGTYDFRKMKKISTFQREATFLYPNDEGKNETKKFNVDIKKFILDYILSGLHILINRSYLTDYFLPIILAIFAIYYNIGRVI